MTDAWQSVDTIPRSTTVLVRTVTGIVCAGRVSGGATLDTRNGIRSMHCWRADNKTGGDLKVVAWRPLPTNAAVTPEPPPIANTSPPIWGLVIADMHARDAEGRRKYGTPLQAGNGRDALVDAYQEALDLAVYLRQAIEERKTR